MHAVASLTFLYLFGPTCISAVKLPFHVRTAYDHSPLHLRGSISGGTNANDTIPVRNTQNAFYLANITLGGTAKRVMLDTGSSDLWVAGSVGTTTDSGKAVTLSYAVGQAKGDVNYADLQFDDYTVKNQAYLLVNDTSTFSTDIEAEGYDGLIGLGPNSGSVIYRELDVKEKGDSSMNRIFSQNKTTQNYLTFLLDRVGDPSDPFTGQMTISEVVEQFSNITSQPKIAVEKVHKLTSRDQHWQILLDKDGIIGPDGQVVAHESIVSGNDDRLVAVLDTGFTFPQVPRKVSDAIYGRVQGAEYDTKTEMWLIPCDMEVNVTLKFGGVEFPLHPLDVNDNNFGAKDSAGNRVCLGALQPITSAFSLLGEYDIILGMSFLRNAYTLIDFGDFVTDASSDQNDPYVQLLPLTDKASAHSDFVQSRLGGVDTTGDSAHALLPASEAQSSPESDAEKKQQLEGKILRQWPYIFLGCLAFVALVVGLTVWKCCCGRNKRAGCCGRGKRSGKTQSLILPTVGGPQKYQQLHDMKTMSR